MLIVVLMHSLSVLPCFVCAVNLYGHHRMPEDFFQHVAAEQWSTLLLPLWNCAIKRCLTVDIT